MSFRGVFIFVIVVVVLGFLFFPDESRNVWDNIVGNVRNNDSPPTPVNHTPSNTSLIPGGSYDTITVANWNIQTFGPSKASNPELLRFYASVLSQYDIVYVQEIRDASGMAFEYLCAYMPREYECEISSRAGRTQMKEQYGVMYKNDIVLVEFKDFNPDSADRWERPPLMNEFNVDGYTFSVFNIHVKPDDVKRELAYLESEANKLEGNVMIIGDLNADCAYYSQRFEPEFGTGWHWVIGNGVRTNMGMTPCAYDRVILNDDMFYEFVDVGVYTEGINKTHSDHFPIWVEIDVTFDSTP